MNNFIFFPKLMRRPEIEYHSNRKEFYSDYRSNYEKVAEDCKHRCVYCDITVEECGGDEMQLDHFRPQNHFAGLRIHPHNLYLSCPKCNFLKTDDWPASKSPGMPSFVGGIGYFDRFCDDPAVYVKVDIDGRIIAVSGPVDYMIKKMHLNRTSRLNVRRKRHLAVRKTKLLESIKKLLLKITEDQQNGEISQEQANEKRGKVCIIFSIYAELK
jgi:hypothetical protein